MLIKTSKIKKLYFKFSETPKYFGTHNKQLLVGMSTHRKNLISQQFIEKNVFSVSTPRRNHPVYLRV